MTAAAHSEWRYVALSSDIEPGSIVGILIDDHHVAVYCLESDGSFHATDNVCTHALAYLSDGWVDGDSIECPLHGGCFDIRSGKGLCDPIKEDLKPYPVRVVDGELHVLFP